MKKAIRTFAKDFAALIALGVVALAVSGYILTQQRLRFPFVTPPTKTIKAEFSTAQAVTPGQGQTVRVSGIKVGDIAKVELREGRAVVTMEVQNEFKNLIRTDATALLRPKTALKDMFVEVQPGRGPVLGEGGMLPVSQTQPDVNLDEFLSVLDRDTRDYLRLLIGSASQGLKGRGESLREVYKRFEPTARDLARVTTKVAERRRNLRRLVFNLNRFNAELGAKDDQLAQLVDGASRTFRAFAREGGNITQAVGELPGALRQTTTALGKVQRFAQIVGPSAEQLRPAVRKIAPANRSLTRLAQVGTPIVRGQIRPFVRRLRPFVRQLRPAAQNLATGTPDLTRSFVVLNRFFNLLGFNANGREDPNVATRDEGYLFWLAWLGHNGGSLFSTSDATGIFRPVALQLNCQLIRQSIEEEPQAAFLKGLVGAVLDPRICPDTASSQALLDSLPGLPQVPGLPSLPRTRKAG